MRDGRTAPSNADTLVHVSLDAVLSDDDFDNDDDFAFDDSDVSARRSEPGDSVQEQQRKRTSTNNSKRKAIGAHEQTAPVDTAEQIPMTTATTTTKKKTKQQTVKSEAAKLKTKKTTKKTAARESAVRDDDPYNSADFEPAAETMADEMQAMKQVFLRMSAKKMQQKEERTEQCKRLYKDAFKADVSQAFKRASRARTVAMDEASGTLQRLSGELQTSAAQLSQAHAAYKKTFAAEFERASADIATLKRILHEADTQRIHATKHIDAEFQKIEDAVELSLQSLRGKLESAASDKTFASTFKLQLERLL